MKNKKLLQKYYLIMCLSILMIPLIFIALNYIFLLSYTILQQITKNDKPFSSSFLYINFYLFFFMILLLFVWIGSKFFKQTVNRIDNIIQAIDNINKNDAYPEKLPFVENSKDEINVLAVGINRLIDRLRYKELMLEENKKMKNEQIQQLSHDINTPLTAVTLELYELAADYNIPEKEIEQIYTKILYTSELVKKVSETSEIDINNQYMFKEMTNITDLIEKSISKWNYLFKKNEISINKSLKVNTMWYMERLFFERVMDNIFSNIIKHSKTKKISIDLYDNDLVIRDYGIGYKTQDRLKNGNGIKVMYSICNKLNLDLKIDSSVNGTIYNIKNLEVRRYE